MNDLEAPGAGDGPQDRGLEAVDAVRGSEHGSELDASGVFHRERDGFGLIC
jgi:hypothetical protein